MHVITNASCTNDVNLWHQQLDHLGVDKLKLLWKQTILDGFSIDKDTKLEFYKGCMLKKQHKAPFSMEGRLCTTIQVIGLIHYDVWGSTKTTSLGGIWYFLTFIDDYFRNTFCYFLKGKGECFSKFAKFKMIG